MNERMHLYALVTLILAITGVMIVPVAQAEEGEKENQIPVPAEQIYYNSYCIPGYETSSFSPAYCHFPGEECVDSGEATCSGLRVRRWEPGTCPGPALTKCRARAESFVVNEYSVFCPTGSSGPDTCVCMGELVGRVISIRWQCSTLP